jgi:hypothetical protein
MNTKTPLGIKRQMHQVWRNSGCQSPLRPACWRLDRYGNLVANKYPDVPDEDEGLPFDPAKPR